MNHSNMYIYSDHNSIFLKTNKKIKDKEGIKYATSERQKRNKKRSKIDLIT